MLWPIRMLLGAVLCIASMCRQQPKERRMLMLMDCKYVFVCSRICLRREGRRWLFGVKSASPPHICKIPVIIQSEYVAAPLPAVTHYMRHLWVEEKLKPQAVEFWFWPSHYRLCPICLANVNTTRYRHQGVNEDIATCYPFINGSQLIFDLLRITAKTNKGMLKGFEAVKLMCFLTAYLAQQVGDSDFWSEAGSGWWTALRCSFQIKSRPDQNQVTQTQPNWHFDGSCFSGGGVLIGIGILAITASHCY